MPSPAPLLRALCVAAAVLVSGTCLAAQAPAKPVDERYVWDLRDLFPSLEAWDAERTRLLSEVEKLPALKGTLGKSATALRDTLDHVSALRKAQYRVSIYANLAADEDQRVAPAMERRALAEKLGSEFSK